MKNNIKPIINIIEATNTRPEKLRVAGYARTSSAQDAQNHSFEAQMQHFERVIKSNPDYEFVGVFGDRGISGTSTKKRVEFNKMIGMAVDGKIDLILVKSVSRFSRNTIDALEVGRSLKAAGVDVYFEEENFYLSEKRAEMALALVSAMAQEEIKRHGIAVRIGQQEGMKKGEAALPYKNFLGYKKGRDGRPEIVEKEAVIVRDIYDLFEGGMSFKDIARTLTNCGVKSPSGLDHWHERTVHSILTNETYKGELLRQKTFTVDYKTKKVRKNNGELPQYLVKDSHPAIIDPERFDRIQIMIAERAAARAKKTSVEK